MFFFPVKREARSMADIVARFPTEAVRPSVQPQYGDAIKHAIVVGSTTQETIADATVVSGKLTLDGDDAAFAILQCSGHSLIAIALPKGGIYQRGVAAFRRVLSGLEQVNAREGLELARSKQSGRMVSC
jgi:hypothetical protein